MKAERRRSPRTAMERLAFISIEPDNGGIVLNVSNGGLSFHSIAPVEPGKNLRFSSNDPNWQIEGEGEMVWTDESGTAGGLRFKAVPSELGDQIRRWVNPAATPAEEPTSAKPESTPTKPLADQSHQRAVSVSSSRRAVVPKVRVHFALSGYARGVLTGLLFSALVAAGFLVYAYRSRLGESLIHIGEAMAGKTKIVGVSAAAPDPAASKSASILVQAPSPLPRRHPLNQVTKAVAAQPDVVSPAPRPGPNSQAAVRQSARNTQLEKPSLLAVKPAATPEIARAPIPPTMPRLSSASAEVVSPPTPANLPKLMKEESAPTALDPLPDMYLEVGKFKHEPEANDARGRLGTMGLQASVVERGHLWMNSYYLLVGPYHDEVNARAASQTLQAHGLKARSFERGSRDFIFGPKLTIDQAAVPAGDCTVRWESYIPDAVVKFVQRDDVVVTVRGRWEKRVGKFEHNAVVYERSPNGSKALLEIQFAGMDRALVFDKSS